MGKSCFSTLFKFEEMQEIVKNFTVVHLDAPGQEEGAAPYPTGYHYVSMDQLAEMIPSIIQFFNRRDLSIERNNTLKCPVLLVVGDQAPHEEAAVECNSKLDPTTTSFLKMADAGGMPQLTQPSKLTEAFKYFIQGMGYMASSCMTRLSRSRTTSLSSSYSLDGSRSRSRTLSQGSVGGNMPSSPSNTMELKPQDGHFNKMFLPTELSHGIFHAPSTLSSPLNASTNEEPTVNHDIFSTPAPADQKPVHTLFTPTLGSPISIPAVQRATTKIQDTKLFDESNPKQVYEDVLFIGQEKCVEDWPEDSPELSPDWKPAMDLMYFPEDITPPGATSGSYYCSEAPKDSIEEDLKKMNDLSFLEDSKTNLENDIPRKARDVKGSEINVSEDHQAKDQMCFPEDIEPPGATSGSYYLSEAAKAEWMSSQRDVRRVRASDNDEEPEEVKEEGDGTNLENDIPRKARDVKGSEINVSEDHQAKDQMCFPEDIEPPGATSGSYYLSEAAKAEWMSSQRDVRRVRASDNDEEPEEVKEEGDGIADKVHRGLKVFYKVFTEQAEVLYQHVLRLYTIGYDISNFHRRAKIANITGGTTTAVGGVAAITGLALTPVTFGASLIVCAVGLGVATAGGITAASATISDNVHDMSDRKKIEVVVQDYETRLADLRRCLQFVAEGLRRMRFHPLLSRNNYYAGDWEVRRALQTVSLAGDPVEYAEDIVERSMVALNSVCKGMDNYFFKDSKELKKGCKKEVTMQVNMLAKVLHEGLVVLNSIRDQLMETMGPV
ncbi:Protein NDRG2 [Bagarius yarrelli]|uniref:Protein NDRG2 n=1 Tax=Bagarius yarrelli TaxID=175774 RepID=A0A556V8C1_BAGYA|nr:Protein NDRG2 [Bagarius yarrelli]